MPLKISQADWADAAAAIRVYGEARRQFRQAQTRLSASMLLSGNDNKVGIAGEYWAKVLFHGEGWMIDEVPASNNPGFDFWIVRSPSRHRVSVKVISDESVRGNQLPLKRDAEWDLLCVVLLTEGLEPYRFGRATRTQYQAAVVAGDIGNQPKVSRSWLGNKGWLRRHGEVKDWN